MLNSRLYSLQQLDNGSTSSQSFDTSSNSTDSLFLQIKVQSIICARQITSLFVRIYPNGIETAVPVAMQIPRSCLKCNDNAVYSTSNRIRVLIESESDSSYSPGRHPPLWNVTMV